MDETLKVKVLTRIFFSEETGYGVFKVSVKGSREQTVIVGSLFDVKTGDFLEVTGQENYHSRFGKQFKVTSFKALLPQDNEGMIKYLSSGRIKGVGKKTAEKIVKTFGKETFEILQKEPERLKEVKGLNKKMRQAVAENMKESKTLRKLTVKLSPLGIGSETVFKIYKEFGEDCFAVLETNAYSLIQRVRGVGFRIADTIAMGMGLEQNDAHRINVGIMYWSDFNEQQKGDLYSDEAELVRNCVQLLDVGESEVQAGIDSLVDRNEMVREELPHPVVLSYKNFAVEKMTAVRLHSLANPVNPPKPRSVNFNRIFKKTSVQLTEEQQDAVISAVNNRITVITGGPGTGKTTIIRAIIEAFEQSDNKILIAAPTGRAAKRIEEATSYPASTIHRMLQVDAETRRFVHDENNPLKADAVIVDEFSMVDSFLFYSLLKAISQHTRLVIIGDKDQLPSVGPGNVLRDVITSEYFDIIYLNQNFRQAEESLIIDNAYRINGGEELIFKPYSDQLDFVFIRVNSEEKALSKILGIMEYYKESYPFNSQDLQVLVPMYRGEAGIDNINARIQEKFNPELTVLKKEQGSYKRLDKVMQLKNNYDKDVFNGEHGIISDFNVDKKMMHVDFDGHSKQYSVQEVDELALSYAVSVHKAQGSEYEMVVLVLLPSHWIMLNRELFYTAATRAKKKLFLISDEATVRRAVANASPSSRKTLLKRRLQEVFEPEDTATESL